MGIPIDSDYSSVLSAYNKQTAGLETKLGNIENATDDELMDVCKSFESYMLEQVMKQMKQAIAPSEEDENDYIDMFGDMLYEQYAKQITENGELGIAQQLYEAMKRDYGVKVRE